MGMQRALTFLLLFTVLSPVLRADEATLRSKDSYHPFREADSPEAWERRSADLRRQILVATGLWPMPTKHSLNAKVHGLVDRDDYTVEKVTLESFPGHFVTGSLYRPKGLKPGQTVPGILSPHGHWTNGRFHDHGDEEFAKQLASGGERFPSGRHPLQARCVQLARMGCVVFHYDMVGYADSQQLDHRKSYLKDGLGSVEAELRSQNMMGIQTFNSIRALDFLEGLSEIDPDRIGVTGASGGGTQTFVLGAIDDRPDLLFPAVMVSTGMQGGCVCENANYLRVGAGNVDLAALAAPRPLGLTGADDWTIEIETKGQPELEKLYAMLEASDHVAVFPFLNYKHNFNAVSRQAMYGFVNEHFQLGFPAPIEERDFQPLTKAEMSVWTDDQPAPTAHGASHEAALLDWWAKDSDLQLATLHAQMNDGGAGAQKYREIIGGAWETMIGRTWKDVGEVSCEMLGKESKDDRITMSGKMSAEKHDEDVEVTFVHPVGEWNGHVVVQWLAQGQSLGADASLLSEGFSIVSVSDGLTKASLVQDSFSGYTFGYNPTLFARRVQAMLTVLQGIHQHPDWNVKKVHLIGEEEGAIIALATHFASQDAPRLGKTLAIFANGGTLSLRPELTKVHYPIRSATSFRFSEVDALTDPWFVPGSVKYGGVDALGRLCTPGKVRHIMQNDAARSVLWLKAE